MRLTKRLSGTPVSQTAPIALGKRIERSSPDFTNGLVSGYLAYFDYHSGKALSDWDIFNLFAESLTDTRYSQLFDVGWCVGLVEAIIEDRSLLAQ
jgi:hypothetical protein